MNPRQHPSASLSLRLSPSKPISPSESDSDSDPDPESGRDICPEALRSLHSAALRAAAQELAPLPDADPRFVARLLKRLDRSGPCWVWTGWCLEKGYGVIEYKGRRIRTHRAAWILFKGPIPDGLCVLHSCDNPPCCYPEHLWLGTDLENVADMVSKGRAASGDRSGARTHRERRPRGQRHPQAKLTDNDVLEIRAASHLSYGARARLYGVERTTISAIVRRKSWTHLL